jgi:hypothetical protein
MTSAQVPALPLKDRIDRVAQHIIRARLFLDLWFYFEEDRSRREIIETMREYGEFFRFAPHACLVTYVVYIAGVFETRQDTISLVVLIREMKASGRLSGQDETAASSLVSSAKPIAKKVAILRNNAIAHRTVSMTYNDVFKLANVKPGELRDVTDTALKIANRLLLACGLQDQHFTDMPRQDAARMMTALAKTDSRQDR